ncbi:hypothetical protein SG586P1_00039 [Streptococcus phage SG586P1]|nr:hypothetical protein SG586P1_00039 [Streptococcus phage SG586P1]WAX18054.1 hypothetical protein SG586P3_00049 [Streptococcus phage SG586P3]
MTVYEKLINVQKELKAPKNQRNSFGNYNYRSCEDILEALKPVLAENGATVFISDKPIVKENLWSYIESTVTFVDIESGESVTVTAFARESESKKGMDVSQITGSASSYARKYALNGLFLIDDTKDADTDEQHNQTAGSKQKAFSKDDVTALRLDLVKVATATKKDVNQLEAWVAQQIGLNSFDSINQSNIAKANVLVKQLMIKAKV